jgi:hypothetical protein
MTPGIHEITLLLAGLTLSTAREMKGLRVDMAELKKYGNLKDLSPDKKVGYL